MKYKKEVIQYVKQFARDTGYPDAIVSHASPYHKLQSPKKFCTNIGTNLIVLEYVTLWENKAELYIDSEK